MIKKYRINQQIKESPIRLIDDTGKNLGVIPLEEAVKMAIEKQLDLIEVAGEVKPPVCRLLDFKKFKYEQERGQKKSNKKRGGELKSIRISLNAHAHDLNIKANKVDKFLKLNDNVKIEMRLKGRQKIHGDIAIDKFKNFLTTIKNQYKVIQELKRQGTNLTIIISPNL